MVNKRLGHDAVAVVMAAGGRHRQLFEGHQVVHDGDVVRRQVPDDVDVLLEQPQVDAGRVVIDDVPEFALADQFLDLAHRPGVNEGVVDEQHLLFLLGQLDQLLGLLDRFGHRLFQPQVPAALDGPLGQLEVGGDRRGDGDGVHVGVGEKIVDVVKAVDLGVELARGFQAVAGKVADGGELEVVVEVEVAGQVRAPVAVSD